MCKHEESRAFDIEMSGARLIVLQMKSYTIIMKETRF